MVWLHNARIIAIFAVVILHVAAGVVIGKPVGSADWWIGNVYDSFARWCVPVFVMISGALLLEPEKKEGLKEFYAKRLSRILVPVMFWSVFYVFWGWLQGQPADPVHLAKKLAAGKPHYHMWFLYMIMVLYIFTPFFKRLIASSSRQEMTVFASVALVCVAINKILGVGESKLFINYFLSYVPYFFIGYLIKSSERTFKTSTLAVVIAASAALTAFGCYLLARRGNLDAGMYFYNYLSVTVIPMSIGMMYWLKKWIKPLVGDRTVQLSALTLGVYLIHPVFLETFISAFDAYRMDYPVVGIPFTVMVVFALSLASAWVINKTPYLKKVI